MNSKISAIYYKIDKEYVPMLSLIDYSELYNDILPITEQELKEIKGLFNKLDFNKQIYLVGDELLSFSEDLLESMFSPTLIKTICEEAGLSSLQEDIKDEDMPLFDTLIRIEDFICSKSEDEVIVLSVFDNAKDFFVY